jgi:hypothetical protein
MVNSTAGPSFWSRLVHAPGPRFWYAHGVHPAVCLCHRALRRFCVCAGLVQSRSTLVQAGPRPGPRFWSTPVQAVVDGVAREEAIAVSEQPYEKLGQLHLAQQQRRAVFSQPEEPTDANDTTLPADPYFYEHARGLHPSQYTQEESEPESDRCHVLSNGDEIEDMDEEQQ